MHIGILTFDFLLSGCRSLKEKRQRMGGLHARFGRDPAIAVCESDHFNQHGVSQWSFVVVATSKREVESLCAQIEHKIEQSVDAQVSNVTRELM